MKDEEHWTRLAKSTLYRVKSKSINKRYLASISQQFAEALKSHKWSPEVKTLMSETIEKVCLYSVPKLDSISVEEVCILVKSHAAIHSPSN